MAVCLPHDRGAQIRENPAINSVSRKTDVAPEHHRAAGVRGASERSSVRDRVRPDMKQGTNACSPAWSRLCGLDLSARQTSADCRLGGPTYPALLNQQLGGT